LTLDMWVKLYNYEFNEYDDVVNCDLVEV